MPPIGKLVGHRQTGRARPRTRAWETPIKHTPITPAFGALIEGIDVHRLRQPALRQLYELWQRHQLLVLRGMRLGGDDLVEFAERVGEVDGLVADAPCETRWHADLAAARRPPLACMLRATEVPAGGGCTWFASLPAALRCMPTELAARLRWLEMQHGPTLHPIVVMQPETGEPTLFLGDRQGARIDSLPTPESERLLNIIWSYATAIPVTLAHRWQPGDMVLWNNLTVMHRHDAVPQGQSRILQRVRFKGRYTLAAPIQKEAA